MIFKFIMIIAILPIILSIFIYKYIQKKRCSNLFKILVIISVFIYLSLICYGYFKFYPPYTAEFCKEDYKEVTKMDMPKHAIIIYKTSSNIDHFGDYTSVFLIELNDKDLAALEKQLIIIGFQNEDNLFDVKELKYVEEIYRIKKYKKQYFFKKDAKQYIVGFLDNDKSVIITRCSW